EVRAIEEVARQGFVFFRHRVRAIAVQRERLLRVRTGLRALLTDPVRTDFFLVVEHAGGQRPAAADALEADVRHLLSERGCGEESGRERQRCDLSGSHGVPLAGLRSVRPLLYPP